MRLTVAQEGGERKKRGEWEKAQHAGNRNRRPTTGRKQPADERAGATRSQPQPALNHWQPTQAGWRTGQRTEQCAHGQPGMQRLATAGPQRNDAQVKCAQNWPDNQPAGALETTRSEPAGSAGGRQRRQALRRMVHGKQRVDSLPTCKKLAAAGAHTGGVRRTSGQPARRAGS